MEDQGKRLLLAVAVAMAIMIGWNFLFPHAPPKKEPPVATQPTGAATPSAATSAPSPAVALVPPAVRGKEVRVELGLESHKVRAIFSSYGAALVSWQLLGEQFYSGARTNPEDLVRSKDEPQWPFQLSFPGSTIEIPLGAEWRVVSHSPTEAVFAYEASGLKVVKAYKLHPDDYVISLAVDVQATSGPLKQTLVLSLGSFQDPAKATKVARTGREWKAACLANDKVTTWSAKEIAGTSKEVGGAVKWFGFTYPYFMAALAIEPHDERVTCRVIGPAATAGPMRVEAQFLPVDLVPGTVYRRTVAGYFGPKYKDKLEAVSGIVGWDSIGFEKSIDLGWLGFLAGPLLSLLTFFHGWVGNWPLAIVLLTLTVKLATLYWTHKSMKSMKSMAKLRPELEKLKEKYKDDRQRQQVETMNLFKQHGVNPMAGCLPMVLQMPIWFALYRALSVAAELYQAPFLWIHDLTAADPYYILPVLVTGMMLVQSLLTPATASGMQQKMLSYGMPILFGFMQLVFPAGLSLYIATNSILTLLHHLYMRAEDKRTSGTPARAAGESVIDVEDLTAGEGTGPQAAGAEKTNGSTGGGRKNPRGRGGKRRGAHS